MAAPAGWYPDPRDPSRDRYWDGEQWTERTRKRQGRGFGNAYRRLPTWAQWGIPILAVLLIIGAATGEEDSGQDTSSKQQVEQAEQLDRLERQLERQQAKVKAERRQARLALRARKRAQVRARRAQRARQAAAAEAETEAEAIEEPVEEPSSECDPNYSGCVPPYPPDVDCGELGESVAVYGSDPHGLDADGDGSGCE